MRNIQKKMQRMENAFDVCAEDLFNQSLKLEEMEKKAGNAEDDMSSLRSRLILLQENNEVPEMKCADVQKPVEKTVYDTQYEIVSEKDCRVEQENVCRSVTEMYERQSKETWRGLTILTPGEV